MRSRFHSVMLEVAKNTTLVKAPFTTRSKRAFSKIHFTFLKRNSSDTPGELIALALLILSGSFAKGVDHCNQDCLESKVLCKVSNGVSHTLADVFVCLAKSKLNLYHLPHDHAVFF